MPSRFDKLSLRFETLCAQAEGSSEHRVVLLKMATVISAMEEVVDVPRDSSWKQKRGVTSTPVALSDRLARQTLWLINKRM